MSTYSLDHLTDGALLRDLVALVAQDRKTTTALLAHLAEVDARKLYLPAAYPSMYAYCVGELRLCEEAAFKRIYAARTARRFPALFAALADGRLHLSAVVMLGPHLTEGTVDELMAAASHQSKSEIEQLLAQRFPRPELLAWVAAGPGQPTSVGDPVMEHAPGRVELTTSQHAPGRVESEAPRAKVAPLSPQRYELQLTMGQSMHDKLRYAQALLSHQVPSGGFTRAWWRVCGRLYVPFWWGSWSGFPHHGHLSYWSESGAKHRAV